MSNATRTRPHTVSAETSRSFATELANSDVSVYTLMKPLGHESTVTSQRYVTAAGAETRTAAAQNTLYGLLAEER
jgi:integrase/recombinase XerC